MYSMAKKMIKLEQLKSTFVTKLLDELHGQINSVSISFSTTIRNRLKAISACTIGFTTSTILVTICSDAVPVDPFFSDAVPVSAVPWDNCSFNSMILYVA